jgi:hypothetical protein
MGELNNNWKGGRAKHSCGYVLIRMPDHPRANHQGYVPEHVIILEQKIGRSLRDDEFPHHINGIKTDNRPENLTVVTRSEHMRLHYKDRLTDSHGRFISNSALWNVPKDE